MKAFIIQTKRMRRIQHLKLSVILPPRFKLQVGVTMVCSGWVNAVFIRNDLPELCTDLVAALSSLNVHELTHGFCCKREERSQTALRIAGGLQNNGNLSVLRDSTKWRSEHTLWIWSTSLLQLDVYFSPPSHSYFKYIPSCPNMPKMPNTIKSIHFYLMSLCKKSTELDH